MGRRPSQEGSSAQVTWSARGLALTVTSEARFVKEMERSDTFKVELNRFHQYNKPSIAHCHFTCCTTTSIRHLDLDIHTYLYISLPIYLVHTQHGSWTDITTRIARPI